MTRTRAKELLPVIQAFAEGKEIETQVEGSGPWVPNSSPAWANRDEYRIKPEPRAYYIVSTNTTGYHTFSNESAAFSFAANQCQKPEIIKVQEVL